jgi:hypothetical protein
VLVGVTVEVVGSVLINGNSMVTEVIDEDNDVESEVDVSPLAKVRDVGVKASLARVEDVEVAVNDDAMPDELITDVILLEREDEAEVEPLGLEELAAEELVTEELVAEEIAGEFVTEKLAGEELIEELTEELTKKPAEELAGEFVTEKLAGEELIEELTEELTKKPAEELAGEFVTEKLAGEELIEELTEELTKKPAEELAGEFVTEKLVADELVVEELLELVGPVEVLELLDKEGLFMPEDEVCIVMGAVEVVDMPIAIVSVVVAPLRVPTSGSSEIVTGIAVTPLFATGLKRGVFSALFGNLC